ncbi:MAG TPA: DUF308 domain-containing protein [Micromonospora sp.]
MSPGGARRGRRDNGLDANEYAVVGDVDPRIGEHLLDVLAAGGIAAYLQPSADLNPITRTTTVPSRPVDRLYVDRAHLQTARDYLSQLTREEATRADDATGDLDTAWARVIAGYHTRVDPAHAPWPAAEDLPDSSGASSAPERERPNGRAGVSPLPSAVDIAGISVDPRTPESSLLDSLEADVPDDDEEGYTPPPPPPLPRVSKYAMVGIAAIVVGFVLFFFPELLPINRGVVTVIGFVSVLAGFVTLIGRLRPDKDEDEDPNDGAIV